MKELWGETPRSSAPEAEPRDSDQTWPPAAALLRKPQGEAAQALYHMDRG